MGGGPDGICLDETKLPGGRGLTAFHDNAVTNPSRKRKRRMAHRSLTLPARILPRQRRRQRADAECLLDPGGGGEKPFVLAPRADELDRERESVRRQPNW